MGDRLFPATAKFTDNLTMFSPPNYLLDPATMV